MTQHTPGPWTLHEGNTAVNGADGHLVASCGFLPYRNKWDSEANARLIAAAPELLEALEGLLSFDCVRWLNDRGPIGEGWQSDELIAAIAAADEAIAKVRGEVSQ